MRLGIEGASYTLTRFYNFDKRNILSHYPTGRIVDSRPIG